MTIGQLLLSGISFPATPAAGALGWYKPENLTQVANVVTGWTDAGSLGRNLSVSGVPAYVANARNGLAGATIASATSDDLNNAAGAGWGDWLPTAAFNAYVVWQFTQTPGLHGGPFGGNANNNPTITFPTNVTATGIGTDGSNKATGTVAVALNTFYIGRLRYDGANLAMRINGTDATPVAFGTYIGTGQVFHLGRNDGSIINGTICETLFYGSLTAAQDTQTLGYLAGRYALTP